MLAEERRNQILALLYSAGHVRTTALVEHFDVSDVTLRSDLQELERRGRLTRTRGGAVTAVTQVGKSTFDARLMRQKSAKQRIALMASQLLRGDQTVIFDAGTTLLALAHHMPPVTGLTVITPALNTAQHLLGVEGVEVVAIGGPVDPDTVSTVWPTEMPGEAVLGAHTAFIGAHGVDADFDIVDVTLPAAASKRRLIQAGRRVVLLADSSKFASDGPAKVAHISGVDVLITDDGLPAGIAEELRSSGLEVVLA